MMDLTIVMALKLTERVGDKTLINVLSNFPNFSIEDLVNNKELHKALKYKSVIEKITNKEYLDSIFAKAKNTIIKHEQLGIKIVPYNSSEYPKLLKLIENPPPILYCKGNESLLKRSKNIAVIGTREPTQYGEVAAKKLARTFANEGYVIVSGLAKGIDTFGHIGALEANNGKTIAVMAGSLDKIYPAENKKLAEKILASGGLLVSEIGIGEGTNKASFVKRDRIQSGLSIGVCPVQAPLKSGTHHTIGFAEKQGRLLFCPKPVEDFSIEATQGIYRLMENNNVFVIENTNDYQRLYLRLENKELELLGEKVLKIKQDKNIIDFQNELKKLVIKGIAITGNKQKVEEIFKDIISK